MKRINIILTSFIREYACPLAMGFFFLYCISPFPSFQHTDGYWIWLPRLSLAAREILNGFIPFWNEYQFCGMNLLADGTTNILNPVSIFYLFFSSEWAYTFGIIILFLVLAFSSWKYFRIIGFSKLSSFAGTFSFVFSGQVLFWSLYHGMNLSLAFFPLILLVFRLFERTGKLKWQLMAFLLLILNFIGGFIQFALFSSVVFCIEGIKKMSLFEIKKNFKNRFLTVFLAMISSAVIIMPTIQIANFSHRKCIQYLPGLMPEISSFINMLLFGTSFGSHGYPNYFYYIGLISIFLFLYSTIKLPKKEIFTPLFIYSLLFPFLVLCVSLKILPNNFQFGVDSDPFRGIFIFAFAMAIIICKGIDILINNLETSKSNNKSIQVKIITLILILLIISNMFSTAKSYLKTNVQHNDHNEINIVTKWQKEGLDVSKLQSEGRVVVIDDGNQMNNGTLEQWSSFYQIRTLGGYGTFYPRSIFLRMKKDKLFPENSHAATHFRNNLRLSTNLMAKYGVKYLIQKGKIKNKQVKKWKLIKKISPDIFLYKNPKYVGRSYMIDNKNNIIKKAQIFENDNSHIKIAVNAEVGKTLILADSWAPGWNCYINEKKVHGFDADGFRGYKFNESGNYIVEWKYQPKSFLYGGILSIFGLLGFSLWMLYLKISLRYNKLLTEQKT